MCAEGVEVCVRVCAGVCVCVCVYVMKCGAVGECMCGCGAVVKTTGAHRQVVGSIPTRKVYTSFSGGISHSLPSTTIRSPLAGSGTRCSLCHHSSMSYTHARTHTHTHTYAHIL